MTILKRLTYKLQASSVKMRDGNLSEHSLASLVQLMLILKQSIAQMCCVLFNMLLETRLFEQEVQREKGGHKCLNIFRGHKRNFILCLLGRSRKTADLQLRGTQRRNSQKENSKGNGLFLCMYSYDSHSVGRSAGSLCILYNLAQLDMFFIW